MNLGVDMEIINLVGELLYTWLTMDSVLQAYSIIIANTIVALYYWFRAVPSARTPWTINMLLSMALLLTWAQMK